MSDAVPVNAPMPPCCLIALCSSRQVYGDLPPSVLSGRLVSAITALSEAEHRAPARRGAVEADANETESKEGGTSRKQQRSHSSDGYSSASSQSSASSSSSSSSSTAFAAKRRAEPIFPARQQSTFGFSRPSEEDASTRNFPQSMAPPSHGQPPSSGESQDLPGSTSTAAWNTASTVRDVYRRLMESMSREAKLKQRLQQLTTEISQLKPNRGSAVPVTPIVPPAKPQPSLPSIPLAEHHKALQALSHENGELREQFDAERREKLKLEIHIEQLSQRLKSIENASSATEEESVWLRSQRQTLLQQVGALQEQLKQAQEQAKDKDTTPPVPSPSGKETSTSQEEPSPMHVSFSSPTTPIARRPVAAVDPITALEQGITVVEEALRSVKIPDLPDAPVLQRLKLSIHRLNQFVVLLMQGLPSSIAGPSPPELPAAKEGAPLPLNSKGTQTIGDPSDATEQCPQALEQDQSEAAERLAVAATLQDIRGAVQQLLKQSQERPLQDETQRPQPSHTSTQRATPAPVEVRWDVEGLLQRIEGAITAGFGRLRHGSHSRQPLGTPSNSSFSSNLSTSSLYSSASMNRENERLKQKVAALQGELTEARRSQMLEKGLRRKLRSLQGKVKELEAAADDVRRESEATTRLLHQRLVAILSGAVSPWDEASQGPQSTSSGYRTPLGQVAAEWLSRASSATPSAAATVSAERYAEALVSLSQKDATIALLQKKLLREQSSMPLASPKARSPRRKQQRRRTVTPTRSRKQPAPQPPVSTLPHSRSLSPPKGRGMNRPLPYKRSHCGRYHHDSHLSGDGGLLEHEMMKRDVPAAVFGTSEGHHLPWDRDAPRRVAEAHTAPSSATPPPQPPLLRRRYKGHSAGENLANLRRWAHKRFQNPILPRTATKEEGDRREHLTDEQETVMSYPLGLCLDPPLNLSCFNRCFTSTFC